MNPSFEDTLRSIVRDVVREELRSAVATRNSSGTYLSITKAARFADVAPGTLRRWIRTGRLPVKRAGRVYRIAQNELEGFLSRGGKDVATAERAKAILQRTR